MKKLRLSKEDTKRLFEDHATINVDMYVIYWDEFGWDWAINPGDVEFYNPDYDELDPEADLDMDYTEVVDLEEPEFDEELY